MKKKLKAYIKKLQFTVNGWLNSIEFYFLKKKADRLHKLTGRRHWIVPKSSNKCMVVDNSYIKIYNSVVKHRKIDIYKLEKMAYYATASGNLTRKSK